MLGRKNVRFQVVFNKNTPGLIDKCKEFVLKLDIIYKSVDIYYYKYYENADQVDRFALTNDETVMETTRKCCRNQVFYVYFLDLRCIQLVIYIICMIEVLYISYLKQKTEKNPDSQHLSLQDTMTPSKNFESYIYIYCQKSG